MRFILHVQVSAEDGNRMVKDPNGVQNLENYINSVKAEAVYFTEEDGLRTFYFVVDIPSADMIPAYAEPLSQGFNARVEFHPAMTLDDVKKGLQKAK